MSGDPERKILLSVRARTHTHIHTRTHTHTTHKDVVIIPGSSNKKFVSNIDSSHIRCT